MKTFIEEDVDASLHELIRGNVLKATRYFHHRLTKFITHIMMADTAPLPVKIYSYKIEFQGRGAPHCHGVCWLDTAELGKRVLNRNGKLVPPSNCPADKPLDRPLEGIEGPFQKIRQNEPLVDKDYALLVTLADSFVTVSTHGPIVGEDVAAIAKAVNTHRHTTTCHKTGCSKCRFRYPRPPAPHTIIARPLPANMSQKEKSEKGALYNSILNIVKSFCDNKERVGQLMAKFNKDVETTPELHHAGRLARIKMMCEELEISYDDYIQALTFSALGYSVVLQRDMDEVYVNNYNVEYLRAWNGNMDMQIVLDFFAVTTYIVEYINKDDTAVAKKMREALKDDTNLNLKDLLKKGANLYSQYRQCGEAEAYYRLLPELKLKMSNVTTQFISTGLPDERSSTFRKATEKQLKAGVNCIEIEGHAGLWYQVPDIWEKYKRRPDCLEEICYAHFARMYKGESGSNNDENEEAPADCQEEAIPGEEESTEDVENGQFHHVMTYLNNGREGRSLPLRINLKNPVPGELQTMVKRTRPVSLRFNKVKVRTQPERFMTKELMMFRPMRGELDADMVTKLYLEEYNGKLKVTKRKDESDIVLLKIILLQVDIVKAQVLPHLEGVEEARHYVAEVIKNLDDEQIATMLDSEGLKDNMECLEEVEEDGIKDIHPDYEFCVANDGEFQSDPDPRAKQAGACVYKASELPSPEDLRIRIRQMDPFQRMVLDIAVTYFKDLVKARKPGNKRPEPPLIACQGGAGAGKSTVINLIDAMASVILLKPGDNPDQPVCVKTAFTGCAAVNIGGNTLSSMFNFPFDGRMAPMNDKTRETKRALLSNLKMVIVDEMSMVKNSHNDLLNFRLGEIMNERNLPYGGIAVLLFGDLCQLRPIKGRFIFEKTHNKTDDEIGLQELAPLWDRFTTLTLEKNHRQGSDGEYADLLNKIRKGEQTDEDLLPLFDRIRPLGHPDLDKADLWICPTRAACNKRNKECVERLPGEAVVLKAAHHHPTQQKYRPPIADDGGIGNTGYKDELRLKVNTRVMLIANVNVADGLCNGQIGTLVDFIMTKKGTVDKLVIKLKDSAAGAENRSQFQHLAHQYPGCIFVEKVVHSYTLSEKSRDDGVSAKLIQFPVVVAFCITCHKIQGQSILWPTLVAMDLDKAFGPAQIYVMLSRVQRLEQLFIIEKINPQKLFYPEKIALTEVGEMEARSLNRNPTAWNNPNLNALRIASLNCAGLQAHYRDLRADHSLLKADILHLSETSLTVKECQFPLPGYEEKHCVVAKGKGISTYFNTKMANKKFNLEMVNRENFQMSKMTLPEMDSINVYRSSNASIPGTLEALQQLISVDKPTLISGDFNLCFTTNPTNGLSSGLQHDGFIQLVDNATQIQGGLIDHLYWRDSLSPMYNAPKVERISSYYSDHDTLMVTLTAVSTENVN